MCIVFVLKRRNKGIGHKNDYKKMADRCREVEAGAGSSNKPLFPNLQSPP
jgi:hypothetical protein